MRALRAAFAASLLLLCGPSAFAQGQGQDVPDITYKDLAAAMQRHQVTILDCNVPKVFEKVHIPGAIHWGSNRNRLGNILPQDKSSLIVCYCTGPS